MRARISNRVGPCSVLLYALSVISFSSVLAQEPLKILSDDLWRSTDTLEEGFAEIQFDDRAWRSASSPYPNTIPPDEAPHGIPGTEALYIWDWPRAGEADGRSGPARAWFRRKFELPAALWSYESARVQINADDSFTLWVNGVEVFAGGLLDGPFEVDILPYLRAGTNVLAVEAEDFTSYEWLLVDATITPRVATTRVVTEVEDGIAGSLRDVVADAEEGDRITFAESLRGETLPLTLGAIVLDRNLVLEGLGALDLSIDADHSSRLFHILNDADVTIAGLTLRRGEDGNNGGGIFCEGASLCVLDCVLSDHEGSWGGGAIDVRNGTLCAIRSTFDGSHGDTGGAIQLGSGSVAAISNSSFSHNYAGSGGAIWVSSGSDLRVSNSTFAENEASSTGSAITCGDSTTELLGVTLAWNTSREGGGRGALASRDGGITLQSCVLANSEGGNCGGPTPSRIVSMGHNVIAYDEENCLSIRPTDIRTEDPGLGKFVDTGAPGGGHVALLPMSAAVDAGDPGLCDANPLFAYDQLAQPRRGVCDAGAVELFGGREPAEVTATLPRGDGVDMRFSHENGHWSPPMRIGEEYGRFGAIAVGKVLQGAVLCPPLVLEASDVLASTLEAVPRLIHFRWECGGSFQSSVVGTLEANPRAAIFLDANDGVHGRPALSANGSQLAYRTNSRGLDPRDDDDFSDAYHLSVGTGALTLVSVNLEGVKSNGDTADVAISGDGRRVAFLSRATNLDPRDNDSNWDAYVKDMETGRLYLATTDADGVRRGPASIFYTALSISGDGLRVAFESQTPGFVPEVTTTDNQVYIKDLESGVLFLASSSAAGEPGDAFQGSPSLSHDGHLVAFTGVFSTNLVPLDPPQSPVAAYVKDLTTGEITLVSTTEDGVVIQPFADSAKLSGDGSSVAFRTISESLDPSDRNGVDDVYVKRLNTGEVLRVSEGEFSRSGDQGSGDWDGIAISHDGDRVAFVTASKTLVRADRDALVDVYLKDLSDGSLRVVSRGLEAKTDADVETIALGPDGRDVAFVTKASNLDVRDVDELEDIYVHDVDTGQVAVVTGTNSSVLAGDGGQGLLAADLDRDGDTDLLECVNVEFNPGLYFIGRGNAWLSDGSGGFTRVPDAFDLRSTFQGWTIALCSHPVDVTSDGIPDLISISHPNGGTSGPFNVYLSRGRGDGRFDVPRFALQVSGAPPSYVTLGDVSGDGRADLLYGQDDDGDPGAVYFHYGFGNGRFSSNARSFEVFDVRPDIESGMDRPAAGRFQTLDVDRDGRLDVLTLHGKMGDAKLQFVRGLGNARFEAPRTIATGIPSIVGFQAHVRLPSLTWFLRGDSTDDGTTDITDAVLVLSFLFLGEQSPTCIAAADINGDEIVNISDPVALLTFLFLGGPPPVPPFEECGPDPGTGELPCNVSSMCQP